jgi:hypothetical protein
MISMSDTRKQETRATLARCFFHLLIHHAIAIDQNAGRERGMEARDDKEHREKNKREREREGMEVPYERMTMMRTTTKTGAGDRRRARLLLLLRGREVL